MKSEHIKNAIEFPPFRVPATTWHGPEPRAAALLLPAMGTTASFYEPFARGLAERGLVVRVAEIPGTGESRPRPSRSVDYGYRELVHDYLPALVDGLKQDSGGLPLIALGHSLGSHMSAMGVLSGTVAIDGLATLAGGNIHYRNWSGGGALKVRFAGALFSSLAAAFGYLPGQHVGFGGPQARTLIREWAGVIRTGRFPFPGTPGKEPEIPMLAIGFEGDDFAPPASVQALARQMNGTQLTLPVDWKGGPHSSWARYPEKTLEALTAWIDEQVL